MAKIVAVVPVSSGTAHAVYYDDNTVSIVNPYTGRAERTVHVDRPDSAGEITRMTQEKRKEYDDSMR